MGNAVVGVQPKMELHVKVLEHNKTEVYHTWGLPDRILPTTWNNVYDVLENPLAFVRASPWDTLKNSSGSSDKSCDINVHLLKKIFNSKILFDTKVDTDELSGVPESQKFIDRYLPGVVKRDPSSETRYISGKAWRGQELSRIHPGDIHNKALQVPPEEISGDYEEPPKKQRITTKCGGRLWGLGFGIAKPSKDKKIDFKEFEMLKASYPTQLLVRFDPEKKYLLYEAFDFIPQLEKSLKFETVTPEELQKIEFIVRQYNAMESPEANENSYEVLMERSNARAEGREPNLPESDIVDIPTPSLSHSEKCQHYGPKLISLLLNWIRWKESTWRRVRFSIEEIVDAQFTIFDYKDRPHCDIPHKIIELHESSDMLEGGRGKIQAESSGPEIEPLGVLKLTLNPKMKSASFACTEVLSVNKFARSFVKGKDWTPKAIFSKATVHYIVGDASEIKELCNFLASRSPKLKNFLNAKNTEFKTGDTESDDGEDSDDSEDGEDLSPVYHNGEAYYKTKAGDVFKGVNQTLIPVELSKAEMESIFPHSDNDEDCTVAEPPEKRLKTVEPSNVTFKNKKDVIDFLTRAGVNVGEFRGYKGDVRYRLNECLLAGLLNGSVKVSTELYNASDASEFLKTVLIGNKKCYNCYKHVTVKVSDVIESPYIKLCCELSEESSEEGSDEESDYKHDCEGCYVQQICQGKPSLTRRKYFHHCTDCPNWGDCVGDERCRHCLRCGKHYFSGYTGFPCDCLGGGAAYEAEHCMGWGVEGDDTARFSRRPQCPVIKPLSNTALSWNGKLIGYDTVSIEDIKSQNDAVRAKQRHVKLVEKIESKEKYYAQIPKNEIEASSCEELESKMSEIDDNHSQILDKIRESPLCDLLETLPEDKLYSIEKIKTFLSGRVSSLVLSIILRTISTSNALGSSNTATTAASRGGSNAPPSSYPFSRRWGYEENRSGVLPKGSRPRLHQSELHQGMLVWVNVTEYDVVRDSETKTFLEGWQPCRLGLSNFPKYVDAHRFEFLSEGRYSYARCVDVEKDMRALTKDEFKGALHFECQALNSTDDIHEFMGEAIERALDKGSITFSSMSSIEIRLLCKFVGPFTTACKRIYKKCNVVFTTDMLSWLGQIYASVDDVATVRRLVELTKKPLSRQARADVRDGICVQEDATIDHFSLLKNIAKAGAGDVFDYLMNESGLNFEDKSGTHRYGYGFRSEGTPVEKVLARIAKFGYTYYKGVSLKHLEGHLKCIRICLEHGATITDDVISWLSSIRGPPVILVSIMQSKGPKMLQELLSYFCHSDSEQYVTSKTNENITSIAKKNGYNADAMVKLNKEKYPGITKSRKLKKNTKLLGYCIDGVDKKCYWCNEMWTTSSWPVYTYTDCIVELLKAGADPTGPCSSQQDNLSSILAYDVDANGSSKNGGSDASTGKRKKKKNNNANAKKRPVSDTTTNESILERSLRLHPRSVTTRILQTVANDNDAANNLEELFAKELLKLRDDCRDKLKKRR